jgi:hypothetical protein
MTCLGCTSDAKLGMQWQLDSKLGRLTSRESDPWMMLRPTSIPKSPLDKFSSMSSSMTASADDEAMSAGIAEQGA